MKTIKSLRGIDFNIIFNAFNEAFQDYEIQLNKSELYAMIQRRGFIPELSFAAFQEDKIIAFALNGIGSFYGQKTAYDTGTGTLEAYRGQGLASKILTHSIPFFKAAGISQYLLEVLQHNTKAVSIYKNLGFEVNREFNYFIQNNKEIRYRSKNLHPDYHLKPIDLTLSESMKAFCDFVPSWQNSFEAISRKVDDFKMLGAFKKHQLLGYCIFEPQSGDITQIAVDKKHRRSGIGTHLLKETLKENRHDSVKVINTEVTCESISGFLKSNSIPQKGKQFEMIKSL